MSLVENLVSQIAANGLNGITKTADLDLQDDTFEKLLSKQMTQSQTTSFNALGSMGAPAGMNIEPLEGINTDELNISTENNKIDKTAYINQPIEFKELDMGDYFSNLLKSKTADNQDFINFAKKHATNAYNVFGKNFVDDMEDFVQDIASSL